MMERYVNHKQRLGRLCLNIIHLFPLVNEYMTCFCLKFEGNTHVNLKGNIWPKMKKNNKQTSKLAKESYLSLIFSNNSLDLVSSIQIGLKN